jgi:hypothetical protein
LFLTDFVDLAGVAGLPARATVPMRAKASAKNDFFMINFKKVCNGNSPYSIEGFSVSAFVRAERYKGGG